MHGIIKIIARLGILRCERGATAVEYGMILALIVLAIMGAVTSFADKTQSMWNNVSANVAAH